MTETEDIHAIVQLQRAFAQLNDEARWPELAALFTADGQFARPSDPKHPLAGREAILEAFLARPRAPARRHLVANPHVALRNASTAHASCYSILVTALDGPRGTIALGGYKDRLVRVPDGWRFQSRIGFTLFDPVAFTSQDTLDRMLSSFEPRPID